MTSDDLTASLLEAIELAPRFRSPFPHVVIDDLLPAGVFDRLRDALPPLGAYLRPERRPGDGDAACERAILPLGNARRGAIEATAPWREFARALEAPGTQRALLSGVGQDRASAPGARPQAQSLLSRDFPPYEIGPHTDVPRRLLSLIYYIAPPGRASAFGTTLFVRDDGRACREGRHYGFEGFTAVKTVEFRPNRALVFARTDRSFHGVLPIPPGLPRRDTLLYEIAYPLCAGRVA